LKTNLLLILSAKTVIKNQFLAASSKFISQNCIFFTVLAANVRYNSQNYYI